MLTFYETVQCQSGVKTVFVVVESCMNNLEQSL